MDMTYVPSWLTMGDRDATGWPKFVTGDERAWLVEKVKEIVTARGVPTITEIVYWIFTLPDSPRWALIDAQFAATHRALLEAGFTQVWTRRP